MTPEHPPYVLFLGGGGFAGAFSLGVLKGFREGGLRDHLGAVYGASAGVLNGAHFLTGEEDKYFPLFVDPATASLVHPERMPAALWHTWRYGVTHTKKGIDVFDIEGKEAMHRERDTLDMAQLKAQPVPLYVSVYNFNDDRMDHIDVRTASDPYALITAASATPPLWGQTGFFEGVEYLDGSIKEPLPGQWLLKDHPSAKLIVVMNDTVKELTGGNMGSLVERTLISWWARAVLGKNVAQAYAERQMILEREYAALKHDSRVVIVTLPEEHKIFHFKSNPTKVAALYEVGHAIGLRIADQLSATCSPS